VLRSIGSSALEIKACPLCRYMWGMPSEHDSSDADAVRALVQELRVQAAQARDRARTYYEMADARGRRGSSQGASSCCELGWIATEQAEILERRAGRLEAERSSAGVEPPVDLDHAPRLDPVCPVCGGGTRRRRQEVSSDGCCSAKCALAAFSGGPLTNPRAKA